MRSIFAALLLIMLSACATPGFAAPRKGPPIIVCDDRLCRYDFPLTTPRRYEQPDKPLFGKARKKFSRKRTLATYAMRPPDGGSLRRSSRGLVPPLKAKADSILAACPGAWIMSAVRHTRVRGSGRLSLHATGQAVDIAGNPRCIYGALRGWAGGYSVDYHRVRPNHVHVSWGGSEHGKRFVHWQPRARRIRLARARY